MSCESHGQNGTLPELPYAFGAIYSQVPSTAKRWGRPPLAMPEGTFTRTILRRRAQLGNNSPPRAAG